MKNKTMLRGLAIIFALVFCFSASTVNAANDEDFAIQTPTDKSNEFYVTQAESISAYNDLLNSFNVSTASAEHEKASTQQTYPDYYGGAYIDSTTGQLIVMVTGRDFIQPLRSVSSTTDNVTYEICEFSYNQLKSLYDDINSRLDYFDNKDIYINSVSIDEKEQKVIIEVLNLTRNKEKEIRKIASSELLSIASVNTVTQQAAFGPGNVATNVEDSTSGTIGFAATRNGTSGFIIAGHAGEIGDEFRSGTTTLGEITHSSYYDASSADAAFVTAESGISLTYRLVNGGSLWAATTNRLPFGTTVYKYGKSTYLTSGQITAATYTIRYSDASFFNCVKTDFYAQKGDSGGPVMIYEGNYGGVSRYTLCGIFSAFHESDTDDDGEVDRFDYSAYSPYSNIVNELNTYCIVSP